MKRVSTAAASALVIAVGAALWQYLPTPDDVYGPFEVTAGMEQQATGRAIEARVTGVRTGPRIRKVQYSPVVADAVGTWVVIDGEAMTTRTDESPNVELWIGPDIYVPTDRLGLLPMVGSLSPGIAVRSSWIFDVPSALVGSGAPPMSLRIWVGDGRMDSRLVIDIPQDDPRVVGSGTIDFEPAELIGT